MMIMAEEEQLIKTILMTDIQKLLKEMYLIILLLKGELYISLILEAQQEKNLFSEALQLEEEDNIIIISLTKQHFSIL